jgi:hypothetical protein
MHNNILDSATAWTTRTLAAVPFLPASSSSLYSSASNCLQGCLQLLQGKLCLLLHQALLCRLFMSGQSPQFSSWQLSRLLLQQSPQPPHPSPCRCEAV